MAAVVVLFVLSLWRAGGFVKPPAPSRSEDPAGLLPLVQAGNLLRAGHDMALIPEQTPAPRPAPLDVPLPGLHLPRNSHDFGRVFSSWDVTHIFAMQNTGTADLEIANLVTFAAAPRPSCRAA